MIATKKRSVALRRRRASLHNNSGCMNTRQIIISAERAHHPTRQPSAGYILAQDEDRSCLESRRPAHITTAPLMSTSS